MSDIGDIAKVLLEVIGLIKELKPTEFEKLEKEWKDDQQKFMEAWKTGDVNTINFIIDKYRNILFEV
jgi:hypothetical protein